MNEAHDQEPIGAERLLAKYRSVPALLSRCPHLRDYPVAERAKTEDGAGLFKSPSPHHFICCVFISLWASSFSCDKFVTDAASSSVRKRASKLVDTVLPSLRPLAVVLPNDVRTVPEDVGNPFKGTTW